MNHLPILPVVLPALAAALMLIDQRAAVQHRLGLLAALLTSALAILMLILSASDWSSVYLLGNWAAPWGIVLLADRLSALMVALCSLLGLGAVLLARSLGPTDSPPHLLQPLLQIQIAGVNGAFLTADLFNLFVFFEVLLIASYGLMLHGQGPARLKAGVQYVVVNLVGSALFLIALGLLYALTGTLNMADMGLRVAAVAPADQGLLRIAALLLASVFLLKAAVVPLHLWLVRTYETVTPAVAALFAILTKVGVYSLVRVVPQVFGESAQAAAWVPSPYLWPAALVTAGIGFAGVFTARNLSQQAAYAIIGSTGTLLIAVAGWQTAMLGAALYSLVHSTLAGAALFLVADVVARAPAVAGNAPAPGPDVAV